MKFLLGRRKLLVAMIVVAAALIVPASIIYIGLKVSPELAVVLARDLAASAGHPLKGVMSSLADFVCFAAGAVALFVMFLTAGRAKRMDLAFLLCSALLSFYLWFDDFFMFHELLAWQFFDLPAPVIYVGLAIAALVYLVVFSGRILKTEFLWLGAALAFMVLSVADNLVADLINRDNQWVLIAEDAFKWAGMVFWARYHIGTAYLFMQRHMSDAGGSAAEQADALAPDRNQADPSWEGANAA